MVGWRNFVFLSALCYQFYTIFAHGGDTLKRGLSLRDEAPLDGGRWRREAQSLVSANGNFELGFFSPGNSSKRYIGIWYKKVKESAVVWIANREEPLKDYGGSLTIAQDGRLMIMQSGIGIHSIVSRSIASTENSSVCLKLWDSGNLELTEGEKPERCRDRLFWQSFDDPSDTYLPGMKLGLSKIGESMKMLTSWRNKDDPRLGSFKLGLDPSGGSSSYLYVRKDKEPMYWMSGFWNGQVFSWIPETGKYNFSFKSDEGGSYFDYSFSGASVFSRLVMDVSGKLKLFSWSEKAQNWSLLWFHPREFCDVYNPCGPNSICDDHASTHCRCLRGFEPSSPREWSSNLWWSGCKRQMPLRCGAGDEFMLLKKMRLPAPSQDFRNSEIRDEDCKTMCQKSCSCKAYAFADRSGSQCYHWSSKDDLLFGIQENNSNGQDLFVRLSDFRPNRTKRQLWIMAPVMVPSILVMGAFIFYLRRAVIKHRGGPRDKGRLLNCNNILTQAKRETSEEVSFFNLADTPLGGKNGLEFQVFSFATMSAATNNFFTANKLGEGGFGPVYKGKLRKGQQIAVKRLSGRSNQGLEEFRNEILLIAKLQHINLVRLLGYCVEGEEKIIVYEYMPNKSLDSFLFDLAKRKLLDWRKRIQIINGITQGLLYLHKYSRLRIIHRDLKASNVLLDSEMNPKISDFGLARIFGQDESEAKTNRIVGTLGYMSPEYAVGGLFSEKSDVFSFGVLLLEIISGKKNTSIHLFEESLNLLGYAWELWKNGRSLDLIDPILRDSSPECAVRRCIHLGLLCVQESARDRPTMSHVAALLSDENTPLPTPTRPAFTLGRDLTMTAAQGTCSVNLLTLSVMEAR